VHEGVTGYSARVHRYERDKHPPRTHAVDKDTHGNGQQQSSQTEPRGHEAGNRCIQMPDLGQVHEQERQDHPLPHRGDQDDAQQQPRVPPGARSVPTEHDALPS